MSTLLDDDFQSYAVGAAPPYGNLVNVAIVVPTIDNSIVGVYGDVKSVNMPSLVALRWPEANPTVSDPAYTALAVAQTLNIGVGGGSDQQGTLLTYRSNFSLAVGGIMAFMEIYEDGTLGFRLFGEVAKVSDFSLLRGGWYKILTNTTFFAAGAFLACTFEIAVNGISVLAGTQISSTRTIASMPVTYINSIDFGGCGGGSFQGRTQIFDAIQPITSSAHPGSPEARISEGVIELVLSPDKWRVYEA